MQRGIGKEKAEIYSISNRNGDRDGVFKWENSCCNRSCTGIGKEIARVYAKLGAKVLISDVNEEKLQKRHVSSWMKDMK